MYNNNDIDSHIVNICSQIDQNIALYPDKDFGLVSQNVLDKLRRLVEYVAVKVCITKSAFKAEDFNSYESHHKAIVHVEHIGKEFSFLSTFWKRLNRVNSHVLIEDESAIRILNGFLEYLYNIKKYLSDECNIAVLKNLSKLSFLSDEEQKYYSEIANIIIKTTRQPYNSSLDERKYYVTKSKSFRANGELFYESTIELAFNKEHKFSRKIVYSRFKIPYYYSVKLALRQESVKMLGISVSILIADKWEASIRLVEFDNLKRLLWGNTKKSTYSYVYKRLMQVLSSLSISLFDLVSIDENQYCKIKIWCTDNNKYIDLFKELDLFREIIGNNQSGTIILSYILQNVRNTVIKEQISNTPNKKLSNLYLKNGCIPFEEMPFCSSLIKHNPKLYVLYSCISLKNREHELIARKIHNNTVGNNQLFSSLNDIKNISSEQLIEYAKIYNNEIYPSHKETRKLCWITKKDQKTNQIIVKEIFYNQQVKDCSSIHNTIDNLLNQPLEGYESLWQSWKKSNQYKIDKEKENLLSNLFKNSKVGFVFGAAGTGKTTLIGIVSEIFKDKSKCFLAYTNSAVQNLKFHLKNENVHTVNKYLSNDSEHYSLLVIDECSVISNEDMKNVLDKNNYDAILLVGDICQIESIQFGNWFYLCHKICKNKFNDAALYSLSTNYRTENNDLANLWKSVRNCVISDIQDYLARGNFCSDINSSIFDRNISESEIVLALNYNGLFGINSINDILQENNPNERVFWGIYKFKVNDPVLFDDTYNFIKNNTKGRIVEILPREDYISFVISVEGEISKENIPRNCCILEKSGNNYTVKITVYKRDNSDNDDDIMYAIPFHLSYAMSIHKCQGLEYDSVKVIITSDVEDKIDFNIFYTAITRAKKNLNIYWSNQTQSKVISNLKKKEIDRDYSLLKQIINNNLKISDF